MSSFRSGPRSRVRMFAATLLFCAGVVPSTAQLSVPLSYNVDSGEGLEAIELLGYSSATGDFNGDGIDDLAVSAPYVAVLGLQRAGRVEVFFGSSEGLGDGPDRLLTQLDAMPSSECGEVEEFDFFGRSLVAGDFNGDGRDDLAVGASLEDIDAKGVAVENNGIVQIFLGQADTGFTASDCLSYGLGELPGEAHENTVFGQALAVGDFQGDGFDDLAIGSPGARVGEDPSGTVTVLHGRADGHFDQAAAQVWSLASPGIPSDPTFSDDFGASLATGDLILGLDVKCDLVVGDPRRQTEPGLGMVTILYGCTPDGLSASGSHQFVSEDFGRSGEGAGMGGSLAVGNFDCSGGDDVAAGLPEYDSDVMDSGEVWVAFGDLDFSPFFSTFARQDIDGVTQELGGFGLALASLPAASGCDDLIVSEPGSDLGALAAGRVFHLPGEPITGPRADRASAYVPAASQEFGSLGLSLTVGRFDGERHHVAVGAPTWTVDGNQAAGLVWILPAGPFFLDGFESGDLSAWSAVVGGL